MSLHRMNSFFTTAVHNSNTIMLSCIRTQQVVLMMMMMMAMAMIMIMIRDLLVALDNNTVSLLFVIIVYLN